VEGATIRRQDAGKKISGRVPSLFGSKSTISRFDERFRDDQYSLVAFSFVVLLLTVPPPCPTICKSGGTCPRAPWSRRHWAYIKCRWTLFIVVFLRELSVLLVEPAVLLNVGVYCVVG